MLPVSARWAPHIAGNHRPVIKCEVWKTTTRLMPALALETGSITKDASTYPRTTATVTVADITPGTAQLLTPFGARLRFHRGVTYPDNTSEIPLLADLDIVGARLVRDPAVTLELTLADPAAVIAQDAYVTPLALPGQTVRQAITRILASRAYYGGREPAAGAPATDTIRTPGDYNVTGDPWDAVEQLADTAAAECYFTPDRQLMLRPEPVLKSTPDATLYALEGGTVTRLEASLTRAPNFVCLWGAPDANGKQIRGLAWDTNPASPTYVGGPYGRVAVEETRPAPFATVGEANTAAANMLARLQRGVRTVTVECVPNPAIEPGDTVRVRFVNGATELHLVRAVTIPLGGPDRMTVECSTTAYTTQGWP